MKKKFKIDWATFQEQLSFQDHKQWSSKELNFYIYLCLYFMKMFNIIVIQSTFIILHFVFIVCSFIFQGPQVYYPLAIKCWPSLNKVRMTLLYLLSENETAYFFDQLPSTPQCFHNFWKQKLHCAWVSTLGLTRVWGMLLPKLF